MCVDLEIKISTIADFAKTIKKNSAISRPEFHGTFSKVINEIVLNFILHLKSITVKVIFEGATNSAY